MIEEEFSNAKDAKSNGGIFSDTTLSALQKYSSKNNGIAPKTAAPASAPAGLLLGYGSESDDD